MNDGGHMDGPSSVPEEPHPLEPKTAWRARMEARKQAALEAVDRGLAHTVTVEVVLGLDDHERLGELLAALDARREFLGPPMGADVGRRVFGVTVVVKARTEGAAQQIATVTILDEMQKLGLVGD